MALISLAEWSKKVGRSYIACLKHAKRGAFPCQFTGNIMVEDNTPYPVTTNGRPKGKKDSYNRTRAKKGEA
jgi:hypothetical protein